jgi:hypothetical protein
VKGFNPSCPHGIFVPVWITLWYIPLEYAKFSRSIAGQVGTIFGEDFSSRSEVSPRLCVNLDLSQGWVSAITAYSPYEEVRLSTSSMMGLLSGALDVVTINILNYSAHDSTHNQSWEVRRPR